MCCNCGPTKVKLIDMPIEHDLSIYRQGIAQRSKVRIVLGVLALLKNHIKYRLSVKLARSRGAKIGENCSIPWALAKIANANLTVGDNTAIGSSRIDLRSRVTIGRHVVIGSDVEILTASHDLDNPEWPVVSFGINIGDYAWLATRCFVLPTCRSIGEGAVCGAGSVVSRSVEDLTVVVGNPARPIRKRLAVHNKLCTESLIGNDLSAFVDASRSTK